MSGGDVAVIGVKEERARIGNLEITKETAFVATDEGIVAVERHRVEQIPQRPALEQLPYRSIPMMAPPPSAPPPSAPPEPPPEREYPWYDFRGKGCGIVILLLLFYLVVGAIFLPLMIIWALIYCLHYLFCSGRDD